MRNLFYLAGILACVALAATCFAWAVTPGLVDAMPEESDSFRALEAHNREVEVRAARLEGENALLRGQLADAERQVLLLRIWGSLDAVPAVLRGPFVDVQAADRIPAQVLPAVPAGP